MMKRHLAALLAMAAASTLAAATPSLAETLRIGISEDTDTLDPTQGRTFGGRQMFAALCDKLFDLDPKGGIVGQLVTDWTVSDDQLEITLTLRPGVKFHDGTPFDAAAVKFNLERAMTLEESARKGELRAIKSIEAVDDATVKLVLSEPFAPLFASLADRAGMMMSPTAIQAVDTATFANAPVCSGPFKFKERVVQDHVTVEKFDDYWDKDRIHFDEVVYRPMPDSTIRLNNLLSGELDIIEGVATSDLDGLKGNDDVKLVDITGLGHVHIQFNVAGDHPVVASQKIRQAVDAAVDRNIINQVVYGGNFVAGNQPVAPTSPFYATKYPVKPADPERAKALIAESGIESPSFTLVVNNEPAFIRAGQVVQSMLAQVGITVTLQPVEGATAIAIMESPDFQAALSTWSGRADPDANAYAYLGCKGAQNFGKYCSEATEAALQSAAKVSDVAKRTAFYTEAADTWMQDLPVIYLYHHKRFFGLDDDLGGFVAVPDGIIRVQGVAEGS
ncbi:MAG: ABC transporter substrate-binding protein [Rhizobiales bacterium]|nr:ABC transporter substrate-binding protein [Hyphomicrobiales bacterium]